MRPYLSGGGGGRGPALIYLRRAPRGGGEATAAPLPARLRGWLLGPEADPSVRWRVLREVLGRRDSDPQVRAAKRAIGARGWAYHVLNRQHPGGHWETPGTSQSELYRPKYIATNWCLLALSDLGVSGDKQRVKKAVDLFLRRFASKDAGLGFARGGGEICFTGNSVKMMAKFGRLHDARVQRAITWIVAHQKGDGGWHCFPSKVGTLDGWEGMAAFAAIPEHERSPEVQRSIERGAQFYLKRGLLREGTRPYAPWRRTHFPAFYYYDFLVGLDFMTALGYGDDRRLRPALDLLESKRNRDGTWDLDALHPDTEDPNYPMRRAWYAFGLEAPGRPSRWITANALAVLRRAGR